MTGQVVYQPEVVPLRWFIADDKGNEVSSLTLNLISHDDHVAVVEKEPLEQDAFKSFLKLSCGLSGAEIGKIKSPDFNSLKLRLSDIVAKGSDFFFKKMGVDFDPDSPVLLQPIVGDDGNKISKIDIEVPAVDTLDLMLKMESQEERTLFITMKCTGLSKGELGRLSTPDWNYTQSRLNDFLNETADFFQSGTSKPSQTSSP